MRTQKTGANWINAKVLAESFEIEAPLASAFNSSRSVISLRHHSPCGKPSRCLLDQKVRAVGDSRVDHFPVGWVIETGWTIFEWYQELLSWLLILAAELIGSMKSKNEQTRLVVV